MPPAADLAEVDGPDGTTLRWSPRRWSVRVRLGGRALGVAYLVKRGDAVHWAHTASAELWPRWQLEECVADLARLAAPRPAR